MCSFGEDGPGDPRHFVGQRAGHDIRVASAQHVPYPFAKHIGSCPNTLHDDARTLDEQPSQILVAALADAQQGRLSAGAVLTRHQPDRGGELASIGKLMGIAQLDGQHTRSDRPNAGISNKRWLRSSSASC